MVDTVRLQFARGLLCALCVGGMSVLSCSGGEGAAVGTSQGALSAPTKVVGFDAGRVGVAPSLAARVPFAGGLLALDDEPWFIDGSDGGAVLLGDLRPGWPAAAFSASTAVAGGRAYFVGPHPAPDVQRTTLWSTDGTFDGTTLAWEGDPVSVLDLAGSTSLGVVVRVPGTGTKEALAVYRGPTTRPQPFLELERGTPVSDFVTLPSGECFLGQVATRRQLVCTDGTDAGTRLLSGEAGQVREVSAPLVSYGGRAWFVGSDGSSTSRWLNATDGTALGTRAASMGLNMVTALGRTATDLVLVADAPGLSEQAGFFTDGTDAGTRLVLPPRAGTTLTQPKLFATTDTHAFFLANSSATRLGVLWGADGTADGGVELAPVAPAASTDTRRAWLATAQRLFFTDAAGVPWVSDGTPAGTVQLSTTASQASGFVALDLTHVLFLARTTSSGLEAWVSDGTPAGTVQLVELGAGPRDGVLSVAPSAASGRGWFWSLTPDGARVRLFVTDGTSAGTREVSAPRMRLRLDRFSALARVNQRLVITSAPQLLSWDPAQGFEALPIRSTAVPAVEDPNGGSWILEDRSGFVHLWHTDGTAAGTVEVLGDGGISGTSTAAALQHVVATRTFVSFLVFEGDYAVYAWGADAGLTRLSAAGAQSSSAPIARGDGVAWLSTMPDAGRQLFVSDGTAGGTRVEATLARVIPGDWAEEPVEFEGRLYFTRRASAGASLERLLPDGGAEVLVPPFSPFNFARWVRAGSSLYAFGGISFGRLDTATSTVTPLATLPASARAELLPVGDGLAFTLMHSTSPRSTSVWVTDGTAAGTRQMTGVTEGGNGPSLAHAWGRRADDLFLATWTRERGLEPGVLTAGATSPTLLAELCPGPCSSVLPVAPAAIGDTLYFVADDGEGGALFSLDVTAASPMGSGGGGGSTGAGGAGGSGAGGGQAGAGGGAAGGDATGGGSGAGAPGGCGCTSSGGAAWWAALGVVVVGWRRRRLTSDA